MPLTVNLVSIDGFSFVDQVDMVIVPTVQGHMGIINERIPFSSILKAGAIYIIKGKGVEKTFLIEGGSIGVRNNIIDIAIDGNIFDAKNISVKDIDDLILESRDKIKQLKEGDKEYIYNHFLIDRLGKMKEALNNNLYKNVSM